MKMSKTKEKMCTCDKKKG